MGVWKTGSNRWQNDRNVDRGSECTRETRRGDARGARRPAGSLAEYHPPASGDAAETQVRHADRQPVSARTAVSDRRRRRPATGYRVSTIKEKVDELAKKTGERAQFIVEEHGERIYLYTEVGQSAVQTGAHVGKRGELYTSAGGKAILAHLPDDRRTEIVDDLAFETETSASIGSVEELSDELETIRERGYAFNVEETTRGSTRSVPS